jgi:hypothetical protein
MRDLVVPIWPNLAASALCSAVVYVRLRFHQERIHREQIEAAEAAGRPPPGDVRK